MTSPPPGLRVRSPKIFLGVRIGIPPPPSHAAATPAESVSRAAAWLRVLPGLRPPPPAIVLRSLRGAAAAAAMFASGAARRRRPVHRRALRGRGVSSLGSLSLPGGYLGRGLCAPCLGLLAGVPCSPAWSWARKARPLLGSVAVTPLRPAWSWAQAALRLCPPPQSCPLPRAAAIADTCSPAAKLHQNALKKHKKASKSPLFVRHIAASVPVCVNGQYAEKPRFRGFSGSH